MIADAMNDDSADAVGDILETILDRENDAVVQRIALGRAVEPYRQHRARGLDPEQRGGFRGRDGYSVSHGFYYVLYRIVIFYNYWHRSQQARAFHPPPPGEGERKPPH